MVDSRLSLDQTAVTKGSKVDAKQTQSAVFLFQARQLDKVHFIVVTVCIWLAQGMAPLGGMASLEYVCHCGRGL